MSRSAPDGRAAQRMFKVVQNLARKASSSRSRPQLERRHCCAP
jgi:hypothetical protein